MLIFAWDIEIGEDHHKHENVIHRQSLLDDIAGEKLQRASLGRLKRVESRDRQQPLAILEAVDREFMERETKDHGQGHPNDTPGQRLAEFHLVRLAVEYTQIEGEHEQDENNEGSVEPPILGKWK